LSYPLEDFEAVIALAASILVERHDVDSPL